MLNDQHMKQFTRSILSFVCITLFSSLYGQELELSEITGTYRGTLEIQNESTIQKIPMEFQLKSTSLAGHVDYILTYDGVPRNYTLIEKNIEKGAFLLDENNGIVIPIRLRNRTFYSFFKVQNSLLQSRLQFDKDILYFEILFSDAREQQKSGATFEAIPAVISYTIKVIQSAFLKKIK